MVRSITAYRSVCGAHDMRARPRDDDDADAYSIPAFCRRHQISESYYFKLKNQGLGPATMQIGRRVLISREAAKHWRSRHTTSNKRA